MHRLLLEVRRRKVLRVAGTYTVAGWIVLQVAEVLTPALSLPAWTLTFIALLLLMGLPICMTLAWLFLAPPEAAAAAGSAGSDPAAPPGRRWTDVALLAAVIVVVAVSAVRLIARDDAGEAESAESAAGMPGAASVAGATAAGATAAGGSSVAVLPFTSFSDDVDDNYFADGLTEELINSLAQLSGLQVPGRTSSFYFKNRNEDLRDIGRQLGVAHVLEGSVRRSGDMLRVTVQLISTADGFHLWSRTYDRTLTDAFTIQNDIANRVASALKVTLLDGESAGSEVDSETKTYPSFLIATALLRERTLSSLTEARRLLEEILRQEPDHVEALAGFAQATIFLAGAYLSIEFEPAAAAAVDAVERALSLDADSVPANLAAGNVYDILGLRTDEQHYQVLAERALSRAMDLAPNDPDVLRTYGGVLARRGRWDLAVDAVERAAVRDPLNRAVRLQLSEALRGVGRLGDARAELEQVLERHPDYVAGHLELGELLIESGAFEAAVPYLRTAHRARTSPRASLALANLYLNLGMTDDVERTLAQLDYAPPSAPLTDLVRHLMAGDDTAALRFAEAELARTNDRIWRPMVVLLALVTGNLDTAREQLRRLEPAVLAPQPDVARMAPSTVLFGANLLVRDGRTAEASGLLEALLSRFAAPAAGFDPVASKLVRAQALAQLGRTDEALRELAAARLQGYRTLFDFDFFLRLDRYPAFAGMRDDLRFRDLLSGIEADNRAVAARLAASAEPAAPAASAG